MNEGVLVSSVPANNLPNNTINHINDKHDISNREPDLDADDEKPKSEDAKQEEENGNN